MRFYCNEKYIPGYFIRAYQQEINVRIDVYNITDIVYDVHNIYVL